MTDSDRLQRLYEHYEMQDKEHCSVNEFKTMLESRAFRHLMAAIYMRLRSEQTALMYEKENVIAAQAVAKAWLDVYNYPEMLLEDFAAKAHNAQFDGDSTANLIKGDDNGTDSASS